FPLEVSAQLVVENRARVAHPVAAPTLNHRLLDRRHEVLENAHDEIAVHEGPRLRRPASAMLRVEAHDRVRDLHVDRPARVYRGVSSVWGGMGGGVGGTRTGSGARGCLEGLSPPGADGNGKGSGCGGIFGPPCCWRQ